MKQKCIECGDGYSKFPCPKCGKTKQECPECKKEMDEIKSIDFDKNGETYLYCKKCKMSKPKYDHT
jgi:predicted RNA-binding Zn-ribbon protein involved in translation (DUF1610 family)